MAKMTYARAIRALTDLGALQKVITGLERIEGYAGSDTDAQQDMINVCCRYGWTRIFEGDGVLRMIRPCQLGRAHHGFRIDWGSQTPAEEQVFRRSYDQGFARALEAVRAKGVAGAREEAASIHAWRTSPAQIRNCFPGAEAPIIPEISPVERAGVMRSSRLQIMRRDGFRCQLCGATSSDSERLEIDQRQPVAEGRSDSDDNLWTFCVVCNRRKGGHSF